MQKQLSLVRLEVKPGCEREMADLIYSALPAGDDDADGGQCYALKMGPHTFGIFDLHDDIDQAHQETGMELAQALMMRVPHLLAKEPTLEHCKIPAVTRATLKFLLA